MHSDERSRIVAIAQSLSANMRIACDKTDQLNRQLEDYGVTVNVELDEELFRAYGLPKYATDGASGFDVRALNSVCIPAGETRLIDTGMKLEVPFGYEAQIRPRSGLALKHQVTVLNTPGTIDSDYRGSVGVIMINHGDTTFRVEKGDRIAQCVICPVIMARLCRVDAVSASHRGAGGFGSTGKG